MHTLQSTTPAWYSSEQVELAISPATARLLLEQALASGFDPATDPARMITPAGAGDMLLMPSVIGEWAGIKVATVAPGNPELGMPRIQATYILMDAQTLTARAMIEGAMLTALRTPAMSAVAADRLAAPDAQTLMVFGTGPQAWGHIEAMAAIRDLREVLVSARNPQRIQELVERVRGIGLSARAAAPHEVSGADIIVCATSATDPLFDGSLVKDGACVVAMGSHEPEYRELDGALMGRSLVVVEDIATALREAGDVIQAIAEGTLEAGSLTTASQLVLGQTARREDAPNIFKGTGMSWQDLVVAAGVHGHFA